MNSLSEKLRDAMRQWSSGVCIVCSQHNGLSHGMTVNSFTSVSLEPPVIVISLALKTRTESIVSEAGRFSVSILKDDQKYLADKFSGKFPEGEGRFNGLDVFTLPDGLPALKGSLAVLECAVRSAIPLGNSTIYLADVTYSSLENQGKPLIYHNREYWTL